MATSDLWTNYLIAYQPNICTCSYYSPFSCTLQRCRMCMRKCPRSRWRWRREQQFSYPDWTHPHHHRRCLPLLQPPPPLIPRGTPNNRRPEVPTSPIPPEEIPCLITATGDAAIHLVMRCPVCFRAPHHRNPRILRQEGVRAILALIRDVFGVHLSPRELSLFIAGYYA